MIMNETVRAKEKKEKQKKNITRRNERKHIEVDSPKVASEMHWRCPLLAFFFDFAIQNREGVGRKTSPEGPWWLRGAFCFTMRAPGALLRAVEGSLGGTLGAPGCPKKKF